MNTPNPSSAEHQGVWELLPWLVNGSLSDPDSRRVEEHLRLCGACRDEYSAQRQIYQVMAVGAAVEQMPTAGLNKLRQRIEKAELGREPRTPSTSQPSRAARGRLRGGAIAACVVATMALAITEAIHWNRGQRHGEAAYYTVTAVAPQHVGAVVRAVFSPTVTLAELQGLLDDAHLKIVSGPTEAGVYALAMSGPQSIEWSLRRLRGHDTVRFAEAIDPVMVPLPPP